jgi:hypothetical protein
VRSIDCERNWTSSSLHGSGWQAIYSGRKLWIDSHVVLSQRRGTCFFLFPSTDFDESAVACGCFAAVKISSDALQTTSLSSWGSLHYMEAGLHKASSCTALNAFFTEKKFSQPGLQSSEEINRQVVNSSICSFAHIPCFYLFHPLRTNVAMTRQEDEEEIIYLLDNALTPGNSLPSSNSKLAPPPVETWLSLSSTL